jgi:uncharacterized protein YuzE
VHDWLVRITYDPVADAAFIYLVEIGPGEVERNAPEAGFARLRSHTVDLEPVEESRHGRAQRGRTFFET